ncbi:MAG: hypothetical protein M3093_01265 [Thermoproteota archaeon]|nr:hypothetical protein [Thermoproteota archaeon]
MTKLTKEGKSFNVLSLLREHRKEEKIWLAIVTLSGYGLPSSTVIE